MHGQQQWSSVAFYLSNTSYQSITFLVFIQPIEVGLHGGFNEEIVQGAELRAKAIENIRGSLILF